MSKRQVIMLLGVWVLILPFLGFPGSWFKVLGFVTGAVIIWVAYRIKPPVSTDKAADRPYSEHRNGPSVPEAPSTGQAADIHNPIANSNNSGSI